MIVDRAEVDQRLISIQKKLSSLESDSNNEISSLNNAVTDLQNAKIAAEKDASKQAATCKELQKWNKELQDSVLSKNIEIETLTSRLKKSEEDFWTQSQILNAKQKEMGELQTQCDNLRQDRDGMEDRYNRSVAECGELKEMIREIKAQQSLDSKKQVDSRVTELQSALNIANQKLAENSDETIEQLKETIRRECEERTSMLIEIEELRDQLRNNGNNNREGYGNKLLVSSSMDRGLGLNFGQQGHYSRDKDPSSDLAHSSASTMNGSLSWASRVNRGNHHASSNNSTTGERDSSSDVYNDATLTNAEKVDRIFSERGSLPPAGVLSESMTRGGHNPSHRSNNARRRKPGRGTF